MYISPSNKIYIGQTINEVKRKNRFRDLTKIYAGGGKLENARQKYLPINFDYKILETIIFKCKSEIGDQLNILEEKYIEQYDTYRNGYNSSPGGRFNYSDKSSISHLNKVHSEETKQKISNSNRLTKSDENYFQNPMSQENRDKLIKRCSKPILQYSIEGEFIKEWESAIEVARFFGLKDQSSIRKCITGKNKTSCGFTWRDKII